MRHELQLLRHFAARRFLRTACLLADIMILRSGIDLNKGLITTPPGTLPMPRLLKCTFCQYQRDIYFSLKIFFIMDALNNSD
jgi:hypothetical protein